MNIDRKGKSKSLLRSWSLKCQSSNGLIGFVELDEEVCLRVCVCAGESESKCKRRELSPLRLQMRIEVLVCLPL